MNWAMDGATAPASQYSPSVASWPLTANVSFPSERTVTCTPFTGAVDPNCGPSPVAALPALSKRRV